MNNKGKAFELFDQRKTASSPEVLDLHLKNHTRHNYCWEWQKGKGTRREGEVREGTRMEGEGKGNLKRKLSVFLLNGSPFCI